MSYKPQDHGKGDHNHNESGCRQNGVLLRIYNLFTFSNQIFHVLIKLGVSVQFTHLPMQDSILNAVIDILASLSYTNNRKMISNFTFVKQICQ